MLNCEIKNLFVTPFWEFNLGDHDKELNNMVYMDGVNYSNHSKQSTDEESKFLESSGYALGVKKLKQYSEQAIFQVLKSLQINYDSMELNSRQEVVFPGMCNSPHHHPDCDLLGVYYVKAPLNSGDLLLLDPRGSVKTLWKEPLVTNDANGNSSRAFYRYKPTPGKLLLFPNYLFHAVETNLSEEERISVVLSIRLK